MSLPQLLVLPSPWVFLPFLPQTATSSWPMHRCRRAFPSSTALMASASSRASPGARSCRRAAPVSSCTGRRPARASSSAWTRPWRSARSLRTRSCSTKRQVSSGLSCWFNCCQLCSLHSAFLCSCQVTSWRNTYSVPPSAIYQLIVGTKATRQAQKAIRECTDRAITMWDFAGIFP